MITDWSDKLPKDLKLPHPSEQIKLAAMDVINFRKNGKRPRGLRAPEHLRDYQFSEVFQFDDFDDLEIYLSEPGTKLLFKADDDATPKTEDVQDMKNKITHTCTDDKITITNTETGRRSEFDKTNTHRLTACYWVTADEVNISGLTEREAAQREEREDRQRHIECLKREVREKEEKLKRLKKKIQDQKDLERRKKYFPYMYTKYVLKGQEELHKHFRVRSGRKLKEKESKKRRKEEKEKGGAWGMGLSSRRNSFFLGWGGGSSSLRDSKKEMKRLRRGLSALEDVSSSDSNSADSVSSIDSENDEDLDKLDPMARYERLRSQTERQSSFSIGLLGGWGSTWSPPKWKLDKAIAKREKKYKNDPRYRDKVDLIIENELRELEAVDEARKQTLPGVPNYDKWFQYDWSMDWIEIDEWELSSFDFIANKFFSDVVEGIKRGVLAWLSFGISEIQRNSGTY